MHRLAYLLLIVSTVAIAQPDPSCDNPPCANDPNDPLSPPAPIPPPSPVAPAPAPTPTPPAPTEQELEAMAPYQGSSVHLSGFAQPQYRLRQNAPGAPDDTDGFRMARAHLMALAGTHAGNLDLSAYFEADLIPTFAMLDAYASVARVLPHGGKLQVDGGQMRVPVSRQNMLSDYNLSFVDKGQVATIAPDRDLGARFDLRVPYATWLRLRGGVYNGEGKNQVTNIDEHLLYAGRVELTPFGRDVPFAESAFGGNYVTLAGSIAHNRLTQGDTHSEQAVTYLGVDVAGAWKGLSGSFEYLEVRNSFQGDDPSTTPPNFKARGFVAQVAYLLPKRLAPVRQARFEIGARIEEIDRNDTVPIGKIGDPFQSVREYTGVLTYYLRAHAIKAQLAASHFTEVEKHLADGTSATYPNDQLLLQVTYWME